MGQCQYPSCIWHTIPGCQGPRKSSNADSPNTAPMTGNGHEKGNAMDREEREGRAEAAEFERLRGRKETAMSEPLPFPGNAWLTLSEAKRRWGFQTSPNQRNYILEADHLAQLAEARAEGMERAAEMIEDWWRRGGVDTGTPHDLIRAEAAAIRAGKGEA